MTDTTVPNQHSSTDSSKRISTEQENKQIDARFNELIQACNKNRQLTKEETENVYRAFSIARTSHDGARRKSGEPYIFHPIEVAMIAVTEMGLGATAVICALLHDVVEDTDITLNELESVFGERVKRIVDGVTKVDHASKLNRQLMEESGNSRRNDISQQAETYRKILLAMCNDVYVIFVKLCDRLHNMRTLSSMKDTKKLAIASETQYLYIPLAHRLGLYNIKTELEELVMKYTNPAEYAEVAHKIAQNSGYSAKIEQCLINPIRQLLDNGDYKYEIKRRTKSVFSCWKKMHNKKIPFEEIYDLYAMRIILDIPKDKEKEECFRVYAKISNLFPTNDSRFRDWITNPKTNGYESLHTTVMTPIGKWVEIQIRSKRMDEIAERGIAAHYLYKETHDNQSETSANTDKKQSNQATDQTESWLMSIRTTLENNQKSALDLVEEFKTTLYTTEIYLFTPKGEIKKLPSHSTVLDFAYAIHSQIGDRCMGAKVNAQVVPIDYELHSGEQVQIITSQTTTPSNEWLGIARTSRAKDHIKASLKRLRQEHMQSGKERLTKILSSICEPDNAATRHRVIHYFNLTNSLDLYYYVDTNRISKDDLIRCFDKSKNPPNLIFLEPYRHLFGDKDSTHPLTEKSSVKKPSPFLLDKGLEHIKTSPAPCCKPVQGDEVVGIVSDNGIVVHRTNCRVAMHEMSVHKENIVRTHWRKGENLSFLSGISITSIDRKGVIQDITRIISDNLGLNIRAITFEASEGVGRGIVMLYVHDLDGLNNLIKLLSTIDGIESVSRI